MPEKKPKELSQPTEVQEAPESTIKRLTEDLAQVRRVAENAINENQILKATLKAIAQLL